MGTIEGKQAIDAYQRHCWFLRRFIMVVRVEVIGGPGAVKTAKKILSALERKVDGEMICEDYVPQLLKSLGYKVVERRWNLYQFGATSYVKFHGEKLPPLEHQIIYAAVWVGSRHWYTSEKQKIIAKLSKLV